MRIEDMDSRVRGNDKKIAVLNKTRGITSGAYSGMTVPGICALLPRNMAITSPFWFVTFMS